MKAHMSDNPLKLSPSGLAALLCARICHDLVSPISALGTAIEVLDDDKNADMHEDALDLVKLSARQASAKLQFLRLAFGAGGSAPGVIGLDTLKSLVDGIYGSGKAEIVWDGEKDGLDKNYARLLLNMIMMAVQTVPRGGTVRVNFDHDLIIKANGPRARVDAAVHQTLAGKAPEDGFDGRTIQPFYSGLIARELRCKLTAEIDGEDVTIKAVLPAPTVETAA